MSSEPLGLRGGTVTVVPYDDRWPGLFEEAAEELRRALGPAILAVHHVGSTAIPGLCAKPVLDVLVSIPDFERGRGLVSPLAELGYEFRPDEEIPDRHFFRRRRDDARTHHLSLAEPASHHHGVTLAFRGALRADAGLSAEYAALKSRLARQYPRNRGAYIGGKAGFVARVLADRGVAGHDAAVQA